MAGSHKKIGHAQHQQLREQGPQVLAWQRRHGLAQARGMCIGLLFSGGLPFLALWKFGWQPASMLLFLVVDVLAVLLGDGLKLLLAGAVVRRSHAQDHRAQQLLSIVGGLIDGSDRYTDHGRGLSPGGLLLLASVCTLFLVPVLAAAFESLGIGSVRAALQAPGFAWAAAASLLLHVGGALLAALQQRGRVAEQQVLFLECGGVIGLFIGLLVLVWLPLNWGSPGLIALLLVMFLFRLCFGLFAMYWIPRVSRALEDYLAGKPIAGSTSPRSRG